MEVRQANMFNSPSQLGLSNLLGLRTEKRKEHPWKMDYKTLEKKGLRFHMSLDCFLLQPSKVIPNMWRD